MTSFVQYEYSTVFSHQVDHELRKTWDEYAGDMITVDTDSLTDTKLIHWIMKYPVSTGRLHCPSTTLYASVIKF